MKSPLGVSDNFLELFTYAAGTWKTPEHFHRWAGISLIAACLEDRVSLPIFDHAPLYPNLWIFLIGGSGVGKDHAVGHALSYLKLDPTGEEVDPLLVLDGKASIPGLYDRLLSYQKETSRESAPAWLISSDVGEQLPLGPEAKDFTSRSLGLYGGRDRMLNDSTRTSGDKLIKRPLLNWLAGCTPRWFPNAIDPEVFHSGYAGRAFFIEGEADERYEHMMKPLMPSDLAAVRAMLRKRVELYLRVEGKFALTKRARTVMDDWLLHRTKDDRGRLSDLEREVRGRQPTAALKLSMILSMAEWTAKEPLRIKWRHVTAAIAIVESLVSGLRLVGNYVYRNEETTVLDSVRQEIKDSKKISRSRLVRAVTQRGVKNAKHLDTILETLVQSGEVGETVERLKDEKGHPKPGPATKYYVWKTSKNARHLHAMRKQEAEAQKGILEDANEQLRQEGLKHVTEGTLPGSSEESQMPTLE